MGLPIWQPGPNVEVLGRRGAENPAREMALEKNDYYIFFSKERERDIDQRH